MTKVLALVDGDILAYKNAAKHQKTFDWGDTGVSTHVDSMDEVKRSVEERLEFIKDTLKVTSKNIIVCFSAPENFRYTVLPSYKSNRVEKERPRMLNDIRRYVRFHYQTHVWNNLEADDVMGIMSTSDSFYSDYTKVIVSEDKDMKTIPGFLFNPDKDTAPKLITELEANRFWMYQTLIGDTTDGYKGCPGVGKVRAEKALKTCTSFLELWEEVLSIYNQRGYTEEDAIVQARVARILRHGDYNKHTGEVNLWTPSSGLT